MNGNELLQLIAIGAIAGAFGQGLRAIVGIKKASDEAAAQGNTLRTEGLDVVRLVFSLFIGAIAGGVGIFTITGFNSGATADITPEIFFGAIGIGYAGTDFIEGFVRTKLPKGISQAASAASVDRMHYSALEHGASTGNADRIKQSCDHLLKLPANAGQCRRLLSLRQGVSQRILGHADRAGERYRRSACRQQWLDGTRLRRGRWPARSRSCCEGRTCNPGAKGVRERACRRGCFWSPTRAWKIPVCVLGEAQGSSQRRLQQDSQLGMGSRSTRQRYLCKSTHCVSIRH